jgi:predicted dehydrogenase
MSEKPTLRWGIIATGMISSWFVADLILDRPDAKANHIIQAIGSSSPEKGKAFVQQYLPGKSPTVYGSYEEVYAASDVDIVYIGTPHAFHKQNCLDAIRHGKHILCEKAFTLNARDAKEVFDAARQKGVFVMEAMWTRHFPIIPALQKVLHHDKAIGTIHRAFCDFSLDQKIAEKGPDSRLKNPALGAGSLLDIGVYSLTLVLLGLEPPVGTQSSPETPRIIAAQTLFDGVDIATSAILLYADGRQGIATSHAGMKSGREFCRIEGSEGTVVVDGPAASVPGAFIVKTLDGKEEKFEFEWPGRGFYWEADAVALDIAAGKTESAVMPWSETIRVMEMMDEIRRQGGAKFPQDAE